MFGFIFFSALVGSTFGASITVENRTMYAPGLELIGIHTSSSLVRQSRYVLFGTNLVDWNTAMKVCESQGASLISLETPEKETDLVGFLASKGHSSAWTSGNDLQTNGVYVWATTHQPFTHSNWRTVLPPNDPDCSCVGLNAVKESLCTTCVGAFRWDEEDCSTLKNFICELNTL